MVPAGLLLTLRTVLVAWLKITVSTPKVSTTATRARICLLTSICDSDSWVARRFDGAPVAAVGRSLPADRHAGDAVLVGHAVGADKDGRAFSCLTGDQDFALNRVIDILDRLGGVGDKQFLGAMAVCVRYHRAVGIANMPLGKLQNFAIGFGKGLPVGLCLERCQIIEKFPRPSSSEIMLVSTTIASSSRAAPTSCGAPIGLSFTFCTGVDAGLIIVSRLP